MSYIKSIKLITTSIDSFSYTERIKIKIGNRSTQISTSVDLTSQYSFFINEQQLSTSRKVLKEEIEINYNNYTLISDYIEDLFYLNDNNYSSLYFHYYEIKKPPLKYYSSNGILGLSYIFDDYKNSLVHLYKLKGLINNLSFSIIKHEKERKLNIGGIDIKDTINKTHTNCNVIGRDKNWDCIIKKASIKGKYQEYTMDINMFNNYAHFTTISEIIYVPSIFFDLLVTHYQAGINQHRCIINQNDNGRYIRCLPSGVYRTGSLEIEIGNSRFTLLIEDLWYCEDEDYCDCLIEENRIKNEWKLGTQFYRNTNVLFDYEQKMIHFYSNKGVDIIESNMNNKDNNRTITFFLFVFILIIGIGFMIIMKIKKAHQITLY